MTATWSSFTVRYGTVLSGIKGDMAVASKAQRAVTGVPPERWAQLGAALQEWREDELGCRVRGRFAADRDINLRLVQDLEKNYRPGTYTRWALQDAARAYGITYASLLAFLRGETGQLERGAGAPARPAADVELFPAVLPPSPFADPVRTAAARPYALAIWDRVRDLPRRVTDPSAAQLGLSGDDAKVWNGTAALDPGDRVWAVADVQRRADARARGREPEGSAAGA